MECVAVGVVAGNCAVVEIHCLCGRHVIVVMYPCHRTAGIVGVARYGAVYEIVLKVALSAVFSHEHSAMVFRSLVVKNIRVSDGEMLVGDIGPSELEHSALVGRLVAGEHTAVDVDICAPYRHGASARVVVALLLVLD